MTMRKHSTPGSRAVHLPGAAGATRHAAFAILAVLAACGGSSVPPAAAPATAAADSAPPARSCVLPSPEQGAGPVRWFHDDYAAASACAIELGRPLVIDMWAHWCHTCLSMKHYILADPGMAPMADRFVWLSLDTDREDAAPVLEKFPVEVWPTFFVVDAADQTIEARYLGSSSVAQFRDFLANGERAYLDGRAGAGALDPDSPLARVRDGDRAATRGDFEAADAAYGAALSRAPADWARRPDVLVSRIGLLYRREAWADCVALGAAAMDQTGRSASALDFAYYTFLCASQVDTDDARAIIELAETRISELVDDRQAPLSVDDRADGLRVLREIRESFGDSAGARRYAEAQRALLDRAAEVAPSPFVAMTYNWPRSEVYVYLGIGDQLVPILEKSVADLPDEYDPPYRLAWVLLNLERLEPALANAEKALALVYGPRKARVQALIADIQHARGDREAERKARAAVVAIYEALPEGQKQPEAEQKAREALAAVDQ